MTAKETETPIKRGLLTVGAIAGALALGFLVDRTELVSDDQTGLLAGGLILVGAALWVWSR